MNNKLKNLTKIELREYSRTLLGYNLDMRKKKAVLLEEVRELRNSRLPNFINYKYIATFVYIIWLVFTAYTISGFGHIGFFILSLPVILGFGMALGVVSGLDKIFKDKSPAELIMTLGLVFLILTFKLYDYIDSPIHYRDSIIYNSSSWIVNKLHLMFNFLTVLITIFFTFFSIKSAISIYTNKNEFDNKK